MSRYIVGITGASGSVYGVRVIEGLLKEGHTVHCIMTHNGEKVMAYELEKDVKSIIEGFEAFSGTFILHDNEDMFSSVASGSFRTDGMIIVPCSMGTLGKISAGITDTLLVRAADVMLKERRSLVLVTRESPLNSIHLENMLKLSRAGADICPPVPAFYDRPKTLDEVINFSVGRLLSRLGVENNLYTPWTEGKTNE